MFVDDVPGLLRGGGGGRLALHVQTFSSFNFHSGGLGMSSQNPGLCTCLPHIYRRVDL